MILNATKAIRIPYEKSTSDQYKEYVLEHIKNVETAFKQYGDLLAYKLELPQDLMLKVVAEHDRSKLDNSLEFEAYRQYFYPEKGQVKDKGFFDVGWLYHQNANSHHPEFWILRDDKGTTILDMPNIDIAEMLLDWAAMSIKFGGSAYEYYQKSGKDKPFSDATRMKVDDLIKIFK